jgi:integrase
VPDEAPQPVGISINELMLKFTAEQLPKYRTSTGEPSAERDCYLGVMRILRELFGETPAKEFGPLKFRAVRKAMVDRGWCRSHINKQCQRLRAIFKFGAGWELLPGEVHHSLRAVEPLMPGDSNAPESKRRHAVPQADIDAMKARLRTRNRDLVDLLLLTGARPAEILSLTTKMIRDRTEREGVWIVPLAHHKTAHHGHDRRLYFNPAAQLILSRYLRLDDPDARLFPIQRKTLGQSIKDACIRAGIPPFTSHWLRHTAGTTIADQSDAESAQRVLGHTTLSMTARYSTAADKRAVDAVKKLG